MCSGRVSSSCSTSGTRRVTEEETKYMPHAPVSTRTKIKKNTPMKHKVTEMNFHKIGVHVSCNVYDLVDRYKISVSQMTTDMIHLSYALPGPFLIHDLSSGV
jgi:hypothetical protein